VRRWRGDDDSSFGTFHAASLYKKRIQSQLLLMAVAAIRSACIGGGTSGTVAIAIAIVVVLPVADTAGSCRGCCRPLPFA
jgi:hypothetical protein